jgi:hypothetical protein
MNDTYTTDTTIEQLHTTLDQIETLAEALGEDFPYDMVSEACHDIRNEILQFEADHFDEFDEDDEDEDDEPA